VELIGSLYADERRWDEVGEREPAKRAALRRSEWGPRLKWLRYVALGLRQDVLPKSRLGLACQYLLNQWDALTAHLHHGQTRIDNNAAENTIRPTKLGMKYGKVTVMESGRPKLPVTGVPEWRRSLG